MPSITVRYIVPSYQLARYDRHKTWITVGNEQYESRLLSQFELAELFLHNATPPSHQTRRREYRAWLKFQMTNHSSVIWYELSLLATAHDLGHDITITVFADTAHGPVIEDAIHWMLKRTRPVDDGRRQPKAGPVIHFHWDRFAESTDDIDPADFVWVTGQGCSRLGYLYDHDGVRTVLVPGYGLVRVRNLDRIHPASYVPDEMVDAAAQMLRDMREDRIEKSIRRRPAYAVELEPITVEVPERYARWDEQAEHFDETMHAGPLLALPALPGSTLPRIRPGAMVRPVLKYNTKGNPAYRVYDYRRPLCRRATPQEIASIW